MLGKISVFPHFDLEGFIFEIKLKIVQSIVYSVCTQYESVTRTTMEENLNRSRRSGIDVCRLLRERGWNS